MKTQISPALMILILMLGLGCKPTSESRPTQAHGSPTEAVSFKNLKPFDVVSGRHVVKLTGAGKVRAGGVVVGSATKSPYTVEWDTTKAVDGVNEVEVQSGTLRAKRRVVVLNNGAEAFFKNGSGGKVVVPPTGYEPQHLRYHWDMTEGVKRMVALLSWTKPGFDLELALGRGMCPHHGTQVAAARSTSSPIMAHYSAPAGEMAPKGQWFAHVRLMNPNQVRGKETPFTIKAFVFK